jgi:hypothetical protein
VDLAEERLKLALKQEAVVETQDHMIHLKDQVADKIILPEQEHLVVVLVEAELLKADLHLQL